MVGRVVFAAIGAAMGWLIMAIAGAPTWVDLCEALLIASAFLYLARSHAS